MIPSPISALFFLLAAGIPAGPPADGPPAPTPQAPAMADLIQQTTRLRGHPFTAPVDWEVLSRDELRAQFMETEIDEADVQLTEKVLKKFGLIPPDLDLRQTLLGLLGEQVVGYYDPKQHKLFALNAADLAQFGSGGAAGGMDEFAHTLVHELAHALQDQHFDLEQFIDEEALTRGEIMDDVIAARLALAEGDATMVGLDYTLASLMPGANAPTSLSMPPNMLDGLLEAMAQGGMEGVEGTTELAAAPPYLRSSLFFPYAKGFQFATALRRAGGWAKVDAAYRSPPESTEQILHVDRYQRDHPTAVPLTNLAPVLGSVWQPERPANLGELDIRLLMQEYLSTAQAEAASTGWDGDRLMLYSHVETQDVLIVWVSVWDSLRDAEEFATAYAQVLRTRYDAAPTAQGAERIWSRPEGDVSVERNGQWVLVVDAVPAATRNAIRGRVWSTVGHLQPTP